MFVPLFDILLASPPSSLLLFLFIDSFESLFAFLRVDKKNEQFIVHFTIYYFNFNFTSFVGSIISTVPSSIMCRCHSQMMIRSNDYVLSSSVIPARGNKSYDADVARRLHGTSND